MHKSGTSPRWYQVMMALETRINTFAYPPGSMIPSEQALTEEFGVSRITVRKGIEALAQRNMLIRRQGVGTFVADDIKPKRQPLRSYLADLHTIFYGTTVRDIHIADVTAPTDIQQDMHLPADSTVTKITRSRYRGGQPFSYLITYVPSSWRHHFDETDVSRYLVTELFQIRMNATIGEAHQTIRAQLAGPEVAEKLSVDPKDPVLHSKMIVYDTEQNVLGIAHLYFRSDRYSFEIRFMGLK